MASNFTRTKDSSTNRVGSGLQRLNRRERKQRLEKTVPPEAKLLIGAPQLKDSIPLKQPSAIKKSKCVNRTKTTINAREINTEGGTAGRLCWVFSKVVSKLGQSTTKELVVENQKAECPA